MSKHQRKELNIYLFSYSKLMIDSKILNGPFNVTILIILIKSVQLKKNTEERFQFDT